MFARRFAALITGTAAFLFATGAFAADPPQACQGGSGCAGSSCPSSIAAAQATVPADACPAHGESQDGVDVFSWNEFIAFNWPATSNCTADTTKSILDVKSGDQGPVVWQAQMSANDVFVATNKRPGGWCNTPTLKSLFAKQPIALKDTAKAAPPAAQALPRLAATTAQPTGVTAVGGVVTDPSGRWLRYERLMNLPEYQAITSNNWYRLKVLNKISSLTLPTGSVEFKSAWKILTPAESASGRYYTTTATVYNTPDGAKSPGANPVTLGLVGLHMIAKTPTRPGFLWSTFEQVDNDSVFFNPNSQAPVNTQTAKKPYKELNPSGKPINPPIQIKRDTPVRADPQLNAYYQQLLAGSVFANYRLISTQWQFGGAPQGAPPHVANIVIETYVQQASNKKAKNPSTGCFACHIDATAKNGKTNTDHSFLFLEAQ